MQISGANLLVASQQVAPAGQSAAPGFAAALQKTSGFTPRDLTRPEPARIATEANPAEAKQGAAAGPVRLGMHFDLKI
jgi:hypothetical protein